MLLLMIEANATSLANTSMDAVAEGTKMCSISVKARFS